MYKKTITYDDFDGNQRTEDFYFNLTKAELMELQFGWDGGLHNVLQKIMQAQDTKRVMEYFKMILLKAYGEKTLDGRGFVKVDADGHSLAQLNFVPTEAYSQMYILLATDEAAASEFINGIMPKNLDEEVKGNNTVEDKKEQAPVLPGPGANK